MLWRYESEPSAALDFDADADVYVASSGRVDSANVHAVPRLANARDTVAKAIRGWPFEPARAQDGTPQAAVVRLRFRIRDELDPSADTIAALRVGAAHDDIQYAVLGHIVASGGIDWLSGNGVALRVRYGGPRRGLPVVIVPGIGASATQWNNVLELLQQTRFALAYDPRGTAESADRPDEAYSVDRHARDLAAILRTGAIDRAIIVGQGTGATIAAELARRAPELVAGLVLVAPAGDYRNVRSPQVSVLDSMRKIATQTDTVSPLRPYFVVTDSVVRERAEADIRAARRVALEETIASVKAYDFTSALEAYSGPKLAILPASSNPLRPPFGPDSLSRAARLTNIARMRINSGGWMHMTKAAEVAQAIEAFALVIDAGERP
jgi:pimeloyl-ACP methyl ester carboxylesterase